MTKYILQRGSTSQIAKSQWETVNEYDTHQEAEKALHDEYAEMVRRCGYVDWDYHFRIIEKEDDKMMSRTEQLVQELQSRLDIEIGLTKQAIGDADQHLCMLSRQLYDVPYPDAARMWHLQNQINKQHPKVLALEEMLNAMKALRKDLDGYLEALTEVEETHKDG